MIQIFNTSIHVAWQVCRSSTAGFAVGLVGLLYGFWSTYSASKSEGELHAIINSQTQTLIQIFQANSAPQIRLAKAEEIQMMPGIPKMGQSEFYQIIPSSMYEELFPEISAANALGDQLPQYYSNEHSFMANYQSIEFAVLLDDGTYIYMLNTFTDAKWNPHNLELRMTDAVSTTVLFERFTMLEEVNFRDRGLEFTVRNNLGFGDAIICSYIFDIQSLTFSVVSVTAQGDIDFDISESCT